MSQLAVEEATEGAVRARVPRPRLEPMRLAIWVGAPAAAWKEMASVLRERMGSVVTRRVALTVLLFRGWPALAMRIVPL